MKKYIVTIFDDETELSKKTSKDISKKEFLRIATNMGFEESYYAGKIYYKKDEFWISDLWHKWQKNPKILDDIVKEYEKCEYFISKLKEIVKQYDFEIYPNYDYQKFNDYVRIVIKIDDDPNHIGEIRYYFNGKIIFSIDDKDFDNTNDFKKYILEYIKQENIRKNREAEKEKEYNAFYNQPPEDILKNIKNNLSRLSKEPLTEGRYVGGYTGKSMSNSAWYSEEHRSLPKSKWTKQKILDIIANNTKELDFILPTLRKLPFSTLKEVCLFEDGWHHTGLAYAETTFYSVDSPRNIVENLIKRGII